MTVSDVESTGGLQDDLMSHVTGEVNAGMERAPVTVHHTALIIVLALIGLWLMGAVFFRKIRM